jgi:SET domain-containing protein
MNKPHQGVYTRLQPSEIHGVGVFAIADIPKGQYIFEPDDSETVFVPSGDTEALPEKLRLLYEDFCVLKDGVYECPASFNSLTPSWYLNSSSEPNVAVDSALKFYALRDIQEGEELTADYSTYSENASNEELS